MPWECDVWIGQWKLFGDDSPFRLDIAMSPWKLALAPQSINPHCGTHVKAMRLQAFSSVPGEE